MKLVRRLFVMTVLALSVFLTSADVAFARNNKVNIVDTAIAAGDFNTLVAALEATGLDDVLADEHGKFTVFAPTDAAFAALGADTINALLADPDTLSDILLYHVITDRRIAEKRVLNQPTRRMANGEFTNLMAADGGIKINDSNIVLTNVRASNGIIHVIDAVLIPPTNNIVETALGVEGEFDILASALVATGLDQVLIDENAEFTVFAPTDAAFEALFAELGEETTNAILNDTEALSNILLYHVKLKKGLNSQQLSNRHELRMANRDRVSISGSSSSLVINESNVVSGNIVTSNGIIHVIDAVLIPPAGH